VPSGKSLGRVDRDQVPIVLTITAASRDFGRQSDRDSDTEHKILKTCLFMNYIATNNVHIVNNNI
jgi:hypothetical protein